MEDRNWGFRTRALHAGSQPDPTTGARAVPIYQSTSFVFEDTADAADLFALQKYGTIYTRISNPTNAAFEERMASLEGGIGAVATASGQAAEFLTVTALASAGDHVVAAAGLYGGTYTLLDVTLRRLGIDTTFVDGTDPDAFAAAVRDNTKLLYTEIIANPSGAVADLAALADVAQAHHLPLAVDSTFATPYLCRPLDYGADIALHSATKFLGGHGTSIGGVIVEAGRFDWDSGRFPHMVDRIPSYNELRWWDNFGEYAFCTKVRAEQLRDVGACLSPFNAFLLLQGIETLPLRMDAHVANARAAAEWLDADDRVAWVLWAGLPDHPQHHLANRYLPKDRAPSSPSAWWAVAPPAPASSSRCRWCRIWPTWATPRRSSSTRRRPPTSSSPTPSWRQGAYRRTWCAYRSGWKMSTTSSGTSTRP